MLRPLDWSLKGEVIPNVLPRIAKLDVPTNAMLVAQSAFVVLPRLSSKSDISSAVGFLPFIPSKSLLNPSLCSFWYILASIPASYPAPVYVKRIRFAISPALPNFTAFLAALFLAATLRYFLDTFCASFTPLVSALAVLKYLVALRPTLPAVVANDAPPVAAAQRDSDIIVPAIKDIPPKKSSAQKLAVVADSKNPISLSSWVL